MAKFIEPVATGKAHVQAIIWLNRNQGRDANSGINDSRQCVSRESVDITVVEWLSQNLRNEYNTVRANKDEPNPTHGTNLSGKTRYVNDVTFSGVKYHVYKRDPGDFCELSSYFLVRQWNQAYELGYKYSSLDLAEVIDEVYAVDSKPEPENDIRKWFVSA